jgi:ElaB/YqjD/DUF883 family membrane-anchored ribosome-binding protein
VTGGTDLVAPRVDGTGQPVSRRSRFVREPAGMKSNRKGQFRMKATGMVVEAEVDRISADKLMADLRVLAADIEQLRRSVADQTGQRIAQVRARAEQSLKAAGVRVAELQDVALAKTRAAGQATDDYVRANPWQVVAVAAVAGVMLGLLLARGSDSNQ